MIVSQSLREAIEKGSLAETEHWILTEPERINTYGQDGYNPLEAAIDAGLDFVELLIKHQVNIHQADARGFSALHFAVHFENYDAAVILIEQGIDVNRQDHWGRTALYLAIHQGSEGTVAKLLEAGADPRLKNGHDLDAVHQAIISEELDILKLLLKSRHANIETVDQEGRGYLEYCVINLPGHPLSPQIATLLMDHGIPMSQLKSAVTWAKQKKDIDVTCLSVIEERLLAFHEKETLSETVAKVIEQEMEALEEGSTPSRPSKQKKRAL